MRVRPRSSCGSDAKYSIAGLSSVSSEPSPTNADICGARAEHARQVIERLHVHQRQDLSSRRIVQHGLESGCASCQCCFVPTIRVPSPPQRRLGNAATKALSITRTRSRSWHRFQCRANAIRAERVAHEPEVLDGITLFAPA